MKAPRGAYWAVALLSLAGFGLGAGAPPLWAHSLKPGSAAEAAAEQLDAGARDPDYDYDPPAAGSYRLPPIRAAADGVVLDETGAQRSLHALLAGKITILAFIYTRCADPNGCPLSLSLLYELHDLSITDAELKQNLQLATLSIDPDYDTPEVMAQQAAQVDDLREGADWRFLTTASMAALRPILKAYDQPIGLKTNPDDPLGPYTHQLRLFLIDRDARVRNIYSLGFLDPRLVLNDVRTLLLEERGQVPKE